MQTFNSRSDCNDTAIISCENEQGSYVSWNLRNEEMTLYSGSFLSGSPKITTAQIRHSNVAIEIAFRNSSFVACTLTITKVSSLLPVTVECNGERREISLDNIFPGNTLQNRTGTPSKLQQNCSIVLLQTLSSQGLFQVFVYFVCFCGIHDTPAELILYHKLQLSLKLLLYLDILPFSFELLTSNNIALYWNLTWEVYYIKELSSSDDVIKASSISDISSIPYYINRNATKLNISICSEEHKGFTIGM